MRWVLLVLCGSLLTGCIVSKNGPVSTTETPGQKRAVSVDVASFRGLRAEIRPDGGHARLVLKAVGDISVDSEQEVSVQESVAGRTAFGFFPWTLADKPGSVPVVDHILAMLVNYGLVLTPTLYSLFIEPFSDFPSSGVNDHVFAGFSLLGFYRYNAEPEVISSSKRTDRSTRDAAVYDVRDFVLEYEGRARRSESGGVTLGEKYESGMEIRAKLTSMTMLPGSLSRQLRQFEGEEIVWKASGVRKWAPTAQTVSSVALAKDELCGIWEVIQSVNSVTTTLGLDKPTELLQVLRVTYELNSDGAFRSTSLVSGRETVCSGTWDCEDGDLVLRMDDHKGGMAETRLCCVRHGEDGLEMRYADLRAYEKMFLVGGIESSSASYDADGTLHHTTLIDNSNNEKDVRVRIETRSVTSPMIFERRAEGEYMER